MSKRVAMARTTIVNGFFYCVKYSGVVPPFTSCNGSYARLDVDSSGKGNAASLLPKYKYYPQMNYLQINGSKPQSITDAQLDFIESLVLNELEAQTRAKHLQIIFDIAVFSSRIPLDESEKDALFSASEIIRHLTAVSKDYLETENLEL